MTAVGVIFDLDGTLVDSLPCIARTVNATLLSFGFPELELDRIKFLLGCKLEEIFNKASGVVDKMLIDSMVKSYVEIYKRNMIDDTNLFPGISTTLDELTKMKIKFAVLSNKHDMFVAPICLNVLKNWELVACEGDGPNKHRKPDPSSSIKIAEKLKVSPSQIYFVGDSPVDIETAINADMISVAVTWGYKDKNELKNSNFCIDNPMDLIEIIKTDKGVL